jgi:hypothetical protein
MPLDPGREGLGKFAADSARLLSIGLQVGLKFRFGFVPP